MATTSRRRQTGPPPGAGRGTPTPRTRTRLAVFAGICAVALVATVLSIRHEAHRAPAGAAPAAHPSLPAGGLAGGPYLLFRDTELTRDYGLVGLVPSRDPGAGRSLSSLR